jgi:hypothetical protein
VNDTVSEALRAVAAYQRDNSDMGYVTSTPGFMSNEEIARRKAETCRLSDQLDALADAAGERHVRYTEFEAIREQYQALGKLPPGVLVSEVARTITGRSRRVMSAEAEEHIAAAETFYAPIIVGPGSRLAGGEKLWRQFMDAAEAYRRGATSFASVYERINEMAVADILLNHDASLAGAQIAYEPEVAGVVTLIDFVVTFPDGEPLYVEVKTVHPTADDSERSWKNHERRREHHPEGVHYIVAKEWMGGQIYGNSFNARSAFMGHMLEFEERLAAAAEVQPGPAVLVVCGTGFEWHGSELEDFADFYIGGVHRADDPFAEMEAHHIKERAIQLRRNVNALAYVKRPMNHVSAEEWCCNVRGPQLGRRLVCRSEAAEETAE